MKIAITLCFLLCISVQGTWGQNAGWKTSQFDFRFIDESTGIRVLPAQLELRRRENTGKNYSVSGDGIEKNGTATVVVENGTYDISVRAKGYEPMSTYFALEGQTLAVDFNLVPLVKIKELSPEYINKMHQMNALVVLGYVVDDFEGIPLKGVQIYSADNAVSATTNDSGFFRFVLPLASSEKGIDARGTLYFKKPGYSMEIRRKFDMWSEGDAIFRVRMIKGTGSNTVDVVTKREVHRDYLGQKK